MKNILLILPEVYLILCALGILISEITDPGAKKRFYTEIALFGIAGAAIQVILNYEMGNSKYFFEVLNNDAFSLFLKLTTLIFLAFSVVQDKFAANNNESYQRPLGEAETLFVKLTVTVVLMLLLSSVNLVFSTFSLIGLLTLCYLTLAFQKKDEQSIYGALFGLVGSSFSIVLLLLGLVLLYRGTGSMDYIEIHRQIQTIDGASRAYVDVSFVCVLFSVFWIWGVFPSHQLTQSVLSSAALSSFYFVGSVFRVASFGFFFRVVMTIYMSPAQQPGQWYPVEMSFSWTKVIAIASAITLLVSAINTLRPKNLRHYLVSVWMVQSGYLLVGFLAFDEVGISSVLYTLLTDLISMGGAVITLSLLEKKYKTVQLKGLIGAAYKAAPQAILFLLLLCSLIGVPPFPGFMSKFSLVSSIMRYGKTELVFACMVCTLISWVSLASVFRAFLVREKNISLHEEILTKKQRLYLVLMILPLLLMSAMSDWILNVAGRSAQFILW